VTTGRLEVVESRRRSRAGGLNCKESRRQDSNPNPVDESQANDEVGARSSWSLMVLSTIDHERKVLASAVM
jgi:hypothetical protein